MKRLHVALLAASVSSLVVFASMRILPACEQQTDRTLPSEVKSRQAELLATTARRNRTRALPFAIQSLTSKERSLTRRVLWGGVPIVIKKYKFLFFPLPKVAVSTFKKLLRRMNGSPDWKQRNVLDPKRMGVTNFDELPLEEAKEILASDEWIRAVFIREPSERLISAYADKIYRFNSSTRFDTFLHSCMTNDERMWWSEGRMHSNICTANQHFLPQAAVLPDMQKWKFVVNFWGRFDHLAEDAKAMLEHLGPGVWEKFGASGWGLWGNNSLFAEQEVPEHASSSGAIAAKYKHLFPSIRKHMTVDYQLFGDMYGWGTAAGQRSRN